MAAMPYATHTHMAPDGLRNFAQAVDFVWGEWADEDLIVLAAKVSEDLKALADRIEKGNEGSNQ